jgi:exodeoxyribonuclease VII large subunit
VSFLVESMEVMGAGSLDAQYRALVDEVRGLGWFAQERKRSLPVIARRVAVVTSRSGAALQDVLATMRRRCAGVGVLLVDVRVQGDVAAEIIGAIREVSRRAVELGVDALLLTRGGGSAEELFLFNDKEIARAIVECSVPVVAAIGHETDTTIAELVADERCATPTQAAMRLTPDRAALERQLDSARVRLHASVRQSIALRRERVRAMSRSAALSTPIGAIAPLKARVQEAASRLDRAAERRLTFLSERVHTASLTLARVRPDVTLAERRERVGAMGRALDRVVRTRRGEMQILADSLARQLDALSPLRTLERGYSITTHKDGRIVRSASSVRGGEVVRTRVADGNFDSVTTGGADQPASCASDPRPERTGRGAVGDSAALFE